MELLHQQGDIIAERYRITDILGEGGIGTTYLAKDLKSGSTVALKALSLRGMADWKMMELFEREARVLSKLEHPGIPKYLDYLQVDTQSDRGFYIAQQLAPGKSLFALVQSGWRGTETEIRRIAIQILEILVYLHSLAPPVIHRDIKPQNIIREENGQVFLVDFGAVQDTYHSTFAKSSTVVGTFGYMAPEQFRGQAVPTTDLYSLGATVLFLLTHRSPADLPQERLKIEFRDRVQISEEFADWLEKMLEPDVEDRFASAKEALEALRGKRRVGVKAPLPWKALIGVGVAAVSSVVVLNSYKWAVLGTLGIKPEICTSHNVDDAVRNYLQQGGNPNGSDNDSNLSFLDCTLRSGSKDAAILLIAKGADVKAKDEDGNTPLHIANNKDVASLLIAKGADVNALDKYDNTPLHTAAGRDSSDIARLLIASGADVNAKDKDGNTPLHGAVMWHIAQLLVDKGADVNAKNKDGNTPLHGAFGGLDRAGIPSLLIASGADVKAKDKDGNTPLHLVVLNRMKEEAELLIAKGADINAKGKEGNTPLHWAVLNPDHWYTGEYSNEHHIPRLLVAKGADVNAKNEEGNTPLHLAVERYTGEIASLLIAKGTDVNAKNKDGNTPLHRAAELSQSHIASLLIAKGADVNAKNKDGNTPLDIANIKQSKEVADLLKSHGAKEK